MKTLLADQQQQVAQCIIQTSQHMIEIECVDSDAFTAWFGAQSEIVQRWANDSEFSAKAGTHLLISDFSSGSLQKVVFGCDSNGSVWEFGELTRKLPRQHVYQVCHQDSDRLVYLALAWGMAAYQFTQYKTPSSGAPARLLVPDGTVFNRVSGMLSAIYLTRSLINYPAEALGPQEMVEFAKHFAKHHGGKAHIVSGKALEKDFPAIHAVGKSSHRPPALIDLEFGKQGAKQLTLVGKGVCFDTGGLNIKPTRAMALMKKDMAGSGHVLGLAHAILQADLDVQLRVLIPTVDNAVSSEAYRPGDVVRTRKGLTVEITDTDAEGRVVLADALAYASEGSPDLIIDMASLTGAARVALGTDVPVFFANRDDLSKILQDKSKECDDLVWALPLYSGYQSMLESSIADMVNAPDAGVGGAITAALFLQRFIGESTWCHMDLMGYNTSSKPSKPKGGEAMGLRALYDYIESWVTIPQ